MISLGYNFVSGHFGLGLSQRFLDKRGETQPTLAGSGSDLGWAYLGVCAQLPISWVVPGLSKFKFGHPMSLSLYSIGSSKTGPAQMEGVVQLTSLLTKKTAPYCGASCIHYVIILKTRVFDKY